jgi:predicted small secreted protein
MKKIIFVIAVILSLTLAGCLNEESGINSDTNSTDSIVTLNEGIWPENEYTEELPTPPGTVNRALLNETKKYCAVFLVDLTDEEYNTYMGLLKQHGFSEAEEVSEDVKGHDYTSTGTILSNGEKALSISYIPGNLGIYISFDTVPSV